jgi:hypothetical protein
LELNIRPETLKLIQERTGNTLEAISVGKDFLSRTQAAHQLRERNDNGDYMKLKGLCTTKEMVSKLNRPPTEWEKILASYISDKRPLTRIYRELKKVNSHCLRALILAIQNAESRRIMVPSQIV